MSKEVRFILLYLVGMWLTYGYTSTFFGQPFQSRVWNELDSWTACVFWPGYWFCKSAVWVWS